MSKIYEALEHAGQERSGASAGAGISLPGGGRTPRSVEEKLLALEQRIATLINTPTGKAVQFMGDQGGKDSSTMATQFARLVAGRLGKPTLLATVGQRPAADRLFPSTGVNTWDAVVAGRASLDDCLSTVDSSPLSVTRMVSSGAAFANLISSGRAPEFIDTLRTKFAYIVVDAPAIDIAYDSVLLTPIMDGVVLTVTAGKTRWQVTRHNIEQIEAQGGRVLGTILNRQRHYIPGWVYRKFL
jgi:receptor protein-tyrosine kinase